MPLRGLNTLDPACTALKLIGLVDLRAEALAAAAMARGGTRELQSGHTRRACQGLSTGSLLLFESPLFELWLLCYLDTAEALVGQPLSGEHLLQHRARVLSASRAETRIWACLDFWSSKHELILMQIWVVLMLSHIVYALRPPDLPRQRPGHAPSAPRGRAPKPATRV